MFLVIPELSGYHFRRQEVLIKTRHTLDTWLSVICPSIRAIDMGLLGQMRINKILNRR